MAFCQLQLEVSCLTVFCHRNPFIISEVHKSTLQFLPENALRHEKGNVLIGLRKILRQKKTCLSCKTKEKTRPTNDPRKKEVEKSGKAVWWLLLVVNLTMSEMN